MLFLVIEVFSNAQNAKKRNVKLVYNNKWTADSLTTIKERMKREYNFDVQFNDVYGGSAYFAGQPNIKFGFYRNYGMFTKSFGIGYIGD